MSAFKDAAGREWRLGIDVWCLRQVKARTGVDIGRLFEDEFKPYRELVRDIGLFVDVLWVLVEDQAVRLGVTDEHFGRALGGDAVEEAAAAFEEAVADFYPSRPRQVLKALAVKTRAAADAASARALTLIAEMDPGATSSPSVTTSPGSSALTPPG